ncbi:MAG: tetratricopeptide repeat protein [Acidobacteriaceae bacterium]|nr:tetratricopeptide repeat protein [Acidobacteriaceae bacterium]
MTLPPFVLVLVFSLILLLGGTIPAPPQATRPPQDTGENQFGTSPTLFSTLAAINAAGYDAGMDSPLNERYRVRTQIRQELAKMNIACLPELKEFYRAHKKASDTADLSQYVSFGLIASGPPKFELPAGDLPPDVAALQGFSELLARFYAQANLQQLWNRSQQAYAAAIAEYQDAVIGTIFEANGYVRNPSGYLGRRFEIFLDLLGAPNQIQVRSYRDDYYVVITPTTASVTDEIRDAYLAYLLDPLTFKYTDVIKSKKALAKYAQEAPALDLPYKDDFSLLVTKCLIKAIDSRLAHGGPDKKQALVAQAMREGFILTAAFADLLPGYEKQPEALRIYYPDLVSAIDVRKEEKRLKNIEFAQSVAPRVVAPPAKMMLDPAEESLQAAEGLYEQGKYQEASKVFKKVFEQTADKAMHGRAYYGLARIAVHENNKDQAVELFQRTADANPNPAITAWAHVYLGRLALAAGDAEKANSQFKLALAMDGASAMARQAAEKGLESSSSSGEKQQ